MTKRLVKNGQHIEIHFPFNWEIIGVVRELPDRDFVKEKSIWRVPATAWHTAQAIAALKPLGFVADDDVLALEKEPRHRAKLVLDERLYPFQREGVRFLVAAGGNAVLADDMGLGKTPQALVFSGMIHGRILVVAPANVLYKWVKEVGKWTDKSAEVIPTSKAPINGKDVTVLSYDIMRLRHEELAAIGFSLVIFDECHALKNYKAQRTRAAKKLAGTIDKKLFLSGTPFLNRPDELFPILHMLLPVSFPNYFTFAKRYCGAMYDGGHWYFPKGIVTNPDELAKRMSGFMIRRTKREVMKELPDKTRTIVPVSFPLAEYHDEEHKFRQWYKNNASTGSYNVLAHMTAMRQVVGRGKVAAALELAQDILEQGEKVVLFAHHHEVVAELKAGLTNYKTGVIIGGVNAKTRQAIVDDFQESDCQVIIMSSAGAEGIDLFAASNIIFVEREWTPAKEEQAEDRLHRNGQKSAVNCWYIMAQDTIDEKLAQTVDEKRKVFGAVIGQDEILATVLQELT